MKAIRYVHTFYFILDIRIAQIERDEREKETCQIFHRKEENYVVMPVTQTQLLPNCYCCWFWCKLPVKLFSLSLSLSPSRKKWKMRNSIKPHTKAVHAYIRKRIASPAFRFQFLIWLCLCARLYTVVEEGSRANVNNLSGAEKSQSVSYTLIIPMPNQTRHGTEIYWETDRT